MEIKKIIIAGVGELGGRIRDVLASASLDVTISDYNFRNADMVIEALPGDAEAKKRVLQVVAKQVSGQVVLATAASSGITEIGSAIEGPQRFVGLNFTFNPLQAKSVVQVVKCLETSEETVQACRGVLGKSTTTVVEVEDSPGLIIDRVMATMINEAAIMYSSRLASVEAIDMAMKLCANWSMGPFEFADNIGVDKVVATLETMSRELGQRYLACRLLKQMVATGRLGKKTGIGFYQYK